MIEVVVFVIFALAAVGGAVVMVGARNPVYSAMGLLLTLFSVAVFYVLNLGHFIAAVQVIVYAGAIMTLFLFVIMLIGDRLEDRAEPLPAQRPAAVTLAVALLVLVLLAGRAAWVTGATSAGPVGGVNGTIEAIAGELFDGWTLAFLGTALLLTIAAVGTIALAQFRTGGDRPLADDDYAPAGTIGEVDG